MKNIRRFNEEYQADGQYPLERLAKQKVDGQDGYPFPVYAIWVPNRQGYLAGMPFVNDDANIVRDNELRYKQIKLFIVEEHAQDYVNELLRNARREGGDIQTIRKLIIVRLVPEDWLRPFNMN